MRRRVVFRRGEERLRAGPWRGDEHVAYLTPIPDCPPPSGSLVEHCLDRLAALGYRQAVTGALAPGEQTGFLKAGFDVREHLHLLRHDLSRIPDAPAAELRRARKTDRPRVLDVDNRAFEEFWRLDEGGLEEALAATPSVRFRVAVEGEVVGYAISGKAGPRGYLQRLAVDPDHHSTGLGRALTVDALRWMERRGAREAVVNTQLGNERALALYRALGFSDQPHHLTVLERAVDGLR